MSENTLMNTDITEDTNSVEMREIKPAEEKPRRKKGMRIAALALCCSLLGGLAGAGGVAAYDGWFRQEETAAETAKSEPGLVRTERDKSVMSVSYASGTEMSAADIYAANVNATVGITTSVTTNYFGFRTTAAASGSGFILTSDGYIATNYHVVEDATEIKVTLYDDTAYQAELIGYDESNDLAVLKIDAENLQTVVLGSSNALRVGDSVIAIGNPLGELTFSLTQGVVSALNRKITVSNNAMTLIQTDCAINSGNSGGALFNTYGEVVGIVNAKYSSSGSSATAAIENIGFAIPIDSVMDILQSIIEKGYIEKPYIGVTVYTLDGGYEAFGLAGAVVSEVEEGSPADKAGIRANDVITKVNGTDIKSVEELKEQIAKGSEGDEITLTVYRQGSSVEIKVTLAVRRQTAQTGKQTQQQGSGNQMPPFGQDGQLPSFGDFGN